MQSTIKLFKAVEIKTRHKKTPDKSMVKETVRRGFIFVPEVYANYTKSELLDMIYMIEQHVGLTPEKMNASFHKSWTKVETASIEELVIEQIIHYITTYGYESIGAYQESTVFIPNESLEIPKLKKNIALVVIKGYTKEEIKEKLLNLLMSGIALSTETVSDVVDIAYHVKLTNDEISEIRNKEVRAMLYDKLDVLPKNAAEFLRYMIFKSTGKSMLIKDRATIEAIKKSTNFGIITYFEDYATQYGLSLLAEIFYRYKPLFLAFREKSDLRPIVNRIRKLAYHCHKPMPQDYLNSVTSMIKHDGCVSTKTLKEELHKVNIFRKIRLAYALKFRSNPEADSILYRIRNGKSYATQFDAEFYSQKHKTTNQAVYNIVEQAIVKDLRSTIKKTKIYIPKNVIYALPATEKQFTGDFPSGSCIRVEKDMIFGIHWTNVDHNRIDLDLSMISSEHKIGWNGLYRNPANNIMFSGDMTDAQEPDGASELFYIKKQAKGTYLIFVNYYNYNESVEVPFKIIVAQDKVKSSFSGGRRTGNPYMIDPNKVIAVSPTKISKRQKLIGLLVSNEYESHFYFAETELGESIAAAENTHAAYARKYLLDYYTNTVSLNDVLAKAGANLDCNRSDCDIDLSTTALDKAKITNLISDCNK